jgi:hypothetical protein
MQKFALLLLVGCFLVRPAIAQRGGGGFRGGMGGGFHGGMGGFHGGGPVGPGFRGGFNGFRGGFRGGFFPGNRFRGNRFVFGFGVPYWSDYGWAYPYYGYSYYPYSAYPYPYVYSYPYAYSYPQSDYGSTYSGSDQTSCPQANGQPLYFVKLTYQSKIWVAEDYWYTAGTLNFVTLQGEQNKTPISSIDRAVTLQLNRECGVVFQLPR